MITSNVEQARTVARLLLEAFREQGIFGNKEMPEDMLPAGVATGSEDHLRFITLTVAIDYMRDASQLWDAARRTYTDPATRYLFDPQTVAMAGPLQVSADMQRYKLSRKMERDASIWQTICLTLTRRFDGRVGAMIERVRGDALELLRLIRNPRLAQGFPNLKGQKIGPLWVRMLYDNCGVQLARIGDVPLPVDIHTAQATVQTGCVRLGSRKGSFEELREAVQQVWREALAGADPGAYPLRLDEPLWMLSRQGCRVTTSWPCQFARHCPVGEQCMGSRLRLTTTGDGAVAAGEFMVAEE